MKCTMTIWAVMASLSAVAARPQTPRPPKPPAAFEQVFEVKEAGTYELTFGYRNFTTNLHDNIQIQVMRTNDLERVAFRLLDYDSNYPADPTTPFAYVDKIVPKTHTEQLAFETPGAYRVRIEGAFGVRLPGQNHWKTRGANPYIDTIDLKLVKAAPTSAPGFVSGAVPRSAKNASVLPKTDRLQLSYHECYGFYTDMTQQLDCGINFNYTGIDAAENYARYDLMTGGKPAFGPTVDFNKEKREPEEGKVGKPDGRLERGFSKSYEQYRRSCYETCVESVKKIVASPDNDYILNWFSAWEECGTYDYGPTSLAKFRHVYLKDKYGTIETLNQRWHTEYKSFDEVPAAVYKDCVGKAKLTDPLALFRARASFIDFRDFCSKEYATWLGLKTKAIYENDPQRRNMYSQYSNNNLGSIRWLEWRPLSFEDALQYTIKPSQTMGFDIYATDDMVSESFEHYSSFSDYRCVPMVKEGNTHALGADLTVRTFWNAFAEGMLGWSCFCFQEGVKPELRKFGMCNLDNDMAPRPKLAGVSDMYRALAQVEPFLAYAKRQTIGKPPAIYYSQTCNLMQERGYGSMFDCAPDSHNRVFEMIRQLGYPCRIITDRQIQETDLLDEVSCVIFCDAQFIPEATMDKLFAWVEKGGHIVADGQTGSFDGHGFPTRRFIDFLGIKPVVRERVSDDVARNLEFGYSDYAFDAVNHDELWLTMQEYIHQRATKHPIGKKLGKIMFSAFGSQRVEIVDGENIVLDNSGRPAWNVRTVGKGSAHYFAGYLGTIYGAGCTQYEWRDSHADYAPRQLFGALLDYFGASKNATSTIVDEWRVRYGSPLVDRHGNQFNAVTSFAGHPIPEFTFTYPLAAKAKAPKAVYVTRDRTRQVMSVPFAYDAAKRTVTVTLPGLQTYVNVISVAEQQYPLLSAEAVDAPQGEYGLTDFRPGDTVAYKLKLYNTTGRKLAPGKVKVRLTEGWLCDRTEVALGAVEPWASSEEVTIRIKAPAVCAARRVRPINFIYESGTTTSTPAVEQVWFQNEALDSKVVR